MYTDTSCDKAALETQTFHLSTSPSKKNAGRHKAS
jgi:hypothetical protein